MVNLDGETIRWESAIIQNRLNWPTKNKEKNDEGKGKVQRQLPKKVRGFPYNSLIQLLLHWQDLEIQSVDQYDTNMYPHSPSL